MEAFVLRKYDEWLANHMEELVRRYPSKVVAVHVLRSGDQGWVFGSAMGNPSALAAALSSVSAETQMTAGSPVAR